MRVHGVTAEQMAAVDDVAVNRFGIGLPMMMENAGRAVLAAFQRELKDLTDVRVLVAAGPGNNGGGGLASIRHLLAAGAHVDVVLAKPLIQMDGLPRVYADLAQGLDVKFWKAGRDRMREAVKDCHWALDALLGYNQSGPLRGTVAEIAETLRAEETSTLALDIPTGLAPDTGKAARGAIRAQATVTLSLPKKGMATQTGKKHTGKVWIASLGLPAAVFLAADIPGPYPTFRGDGLVPWP